jgi:hypothetical protein
VVDAQLGQRVTQLQTAGSATDDDDVIAAGGKRLLR